MAKDRASKYDVELHGTGLKYKNTIKSSKLTVSRISGIKGYYIALNKKRKTQSSSIIFDLGGEGSLKIIIMN